MIAKSESPLHTMGMGRTLATLLEGGEAIGLTGRLGAGKTCFAKGLADGLGIDPRDVTSPTFLLLHQLEGRLLLNHLDAYRIGGADDLLELGAAELFGAGSVVLLEWADRAPGLLPGDRLEIDLESLGEQVRRLTARALGPVHVDLLDRFSLRLASEELQR